MEALAAVLGVELSADALDEDEAMLEGERLLELGKIEYEQANYEEAKKCYSKARALFLKHPKGEADAIRGLGISISTLGTTQKPSSTANRPLTSRDRWVISAKKGSVSGASETSFARAPPRTWGPHQRSRDWP